MYSDSLELSSSLILWNYPVFPLSRSFRTNWFPDKLVHGRKGWTHFKWSKYGWIFLRKSWFAYKTLLYTSSSLVVLRSLISNANQLFSRTFKFYPFHSISPKTVDFQIPDTFPFNFHIRSSLHLHSNSALFLNLDWLNFPVPTWCIHIPSKKDDWKRFKNNCKSLETIAIATTMRLEIKSYM